MTKYQAGRPRPMTTLHCPNPECLDSEELKTVDTVIAVTPTRLKRYTDTGKMHFDPITGSVVDWDTAVTIAVRCESCGWRYDGSDWEQKLLTFEQVEALLADAAFLDEALR